MTHQLGGLLQWASGFHFRLPACASSTQPRRLPAWSALMPWLRFWPGIVCPKPWGRQWQATPRRLPLLGSSPWAAPLLHPPHWRKGSKRDHVSGEKGGCTDYTWGRARSNQQPPISVQPVSCIPAHPKKFEPFPSHKPPSDQRKGKLQK